jgi:hypothetical protein
MAELRTQGPPGGTAHLARDKATEDDMRARYNQLKDAIDDINRRRHAVFIRRPFPWIYKSERDIRIRVGFEDPEELMSLTKYLQDSNPLVQAEAREILQSQEWQDLNRIERNIRPMEEDLWDQLEKKRKENNLNQVMARGEGKPNVSPHMRRGEYWHAGVNRR